ncbi:MAG: selenocysteine-specific translation elongation factor [Planctomycetota bacterium]
MTYTIVGVIGHIDHGKTSLVAALTGVDTDTHPEEKRRGITIDLGFASYTDGENQFALIDAPGHQKYIGNLLAGVSAVDVGLLVVAVDQGIQAQTLEHAAILQSLGVDQLLVVMSRIDLADQSTRDELEEELDFFLAEFGFEDISKIPVSTVTGEGLDSLKSQLCEMARKTERSQHGPFRMPVDRVFTIEGRGCVIAGTPWSGTVNLGDQVEVVRSGQTARVRELEVHGADVSESIVGMRTAINLAGINASDFQRGDELVSPHSHQGHKRFLVELTMFSDAAELKCPATIQWHTAATSCEATLRGPRKVNASETAIVVVDAESSVVATFDQSCLFRKPYPVGSFAGGRVLVNLDAGDRKVNRLLELGQVLAHGNAAERLRAWVQYRGEVIIDSDENLLRLGIESSELSDAIAACCEDESIDKIADRHLVSVESLERTSRFVIKQLTAQSDSGGDAWIAEDGVVRRSASAGSPLLVSHVIQRLLTDKKVVRFNSLLALASESTVLSKKQRAKMEQVLELYRNNRTPPTMKELAQKTESTMEAVTSLVRFAGQQKILLEVSGGLFIAAETMTELSCELRDLFREGPQSVAAIRDHWGVTRKHAIPLLEFCDHEGLTIRAGDARSAGPELNGFCGEESKKEQIVEQD